MTTNDDVIRVRLRYADTDTFVEKFAPNVTRGGIFLATRDLRPVGDVLRFEVSIAEGAPILSGEGRVTWVKEPNPSEPHRPYGMGVQFIYVDPDARPLLDRLLEKKGAARPAAPAAAPAEKRPVTEGRPTQPQPSLAELDEDLDEAALRRALDRARSLAARVDDVQALAAPEAEQTATLADALGDLPRLVGGRPKPAGLGGGTG